MKMSEAILKGMERFPENSVGTFVHILPDDSYGQRACAVGCANYAVSGNPITPASELNLKREARWYEPAIAFHNEYGLGIEDASDAGIPRDVIAGMLAAIGH